MMMSEGPRETAVGRVPGEGRAPFLLDPDVVFLNHGSFGACPAPVFDVYRAWQRELENQPVAFLGRRAPDLLRAARTRLADYLRADPDDLVYVPNATTGVNIVARSLQLGPGDEVLSTDHEYGACDRTWRFLCEKSGATYRQVPIDAPVTDHQAWVDAVWAGVGPRTRVLFLSHITSPTGLVTPVAALCARAREAGILSLIDGAHAPGQIALDLDEIGADFYTGNCHKWLCAPKGAAFLHARREAQDLLEPLVVSWGWDNPYPSSGSRFLDEQELTGTRDLAPYLSVPAAIDFQREQDWDSVRARCHRLLLETRARLLALPGVEPIHPDEREGTVWTAQMEAVAVPHADPLALHDRLYEQHGIEIPVYAWNDRTILRVSIQGYNTHRDVDLLIEALEGMLA